MAEPDAHHPGRRGRQRQGADRGVLDHPADVHQPFGVGPPQGGVDEPSDIGGFGLAQPLAQAVHPGPAGALVVGPPANLVRWNSWRS